MLYEVITLSGLDRHFKFVDRVNPFGCRKFQGRERGQGVELKHLDRLGHGLRGLILGDLGSYNFV